MPLFENICATFHSFFFSYDHENTYTKELGFQIIYEWNFNARCFQALQLWRALNGVSYHISWITPASFVTLFCGVPRNAGRLVRISFAMNSISRTNFSNSTLSNKTILSSVPAPFKHGTQIPAEKIINSYFAQQTETFSCQVQTDFRFWFGTSSFFFFPLDMILTRFKPKYCMKFAVAQGLHFLRQQQLDQCIKNVVY